jgi:hypothetical protein
MWRDSRFGVENPIFGQENNHFFEKKTTLLTRNSTIPDRFQPSERGLTFSQLRLLWYGLGFGFGFPSSFGALEATHDRHYHFLLLFS